MNGERDFLRWISANDALLAIAALAMMQRKEERERGGRERDDLQSFITQRLSASEDVARRQGGREREGDDDGWSGLKGFELLTTSY